VVWCISQASLRRILLRGQRDRFQRIMGYLDQVDLLQGLLSHEKLELAQNFLIEAFKPGDWIVRQGERQNVWYILIEGVCEFLDEDQVLATVRPPQYFGERALLKDKPAEYSVRVTSDGTVRCLILDGPTFKELVGLLRNDTAFRHALEDDLVGYSEYKGGRTLVGFQARLREAQENKAASPTKPNFPSAPLRLDPHASLDVRALKRVRLLGIGGFGVVTLEQDPATGETFALKTLSKGLVVKNGLQESVRNEREILTMIDSPFCARLYGTFKDERYLYFLFEPLLGGDLHERMSSEPDIFGRPVVIRFLIGCLICAIAHLHERNIVFRDLKPENVLMDSMGYAKLCDYGFAKFVLGRTLTICGTPEYMAPEAIRNIGYGRMVDWWALGVLSYELISGNTPFGIDDDDEDDDDDRARAQPEVIFANILEGIEAVPCPFVDIKTSTFDGAEAWDFVRGLLRYSPGKRLGIGGSAQVKVHPFLKSVDFPALERKELTPPDPRLATPEFLDSSLGSAEDAQAALYVDDFVDDTSGWDDVF